MATKRQELCGNIIEFSLFIRQYVHDQTKRAPVEYREKKNWIHSLKSLTDGLSLPERATSKSKLKTH